MRKPIPGAHSCASFLFAAQLLMPTHHLSAASDATPAAQATPASALTVLPGFKVDLIRSAPEAEGSWICLTADDRGRLIISPSKDDKPLLRVTLSAAGQVEKVEPVPAPLRQAMGMCYAHDSLYLTAHGPHGTGLYRLVDANHNDQFDASEVHFLEKIAGEGEHGYHAVVAGPDGMMYVMNGNTTKVPENILPRSPHRNFQEDLLLPRLWDPIGLNVGVYAPGGHLLRFDPEGKQFELITAGFRNAYDFDFNPDGEIFTFDSDMEWDWGLPWYRPTRILHAIPGGEYGWRSGAGMWPDYFADSLPPVMNMGIGSPTGVKFGTKSNFPPKYRDALFAMDWSYGRIFAVHLQPQGASYTARPEVFLQGRPLNLTSMAFGRDGAMYFITGGRGTQSGLYRVSYAGNLGTENATAESAPAGPEVKAAAAARAVLRQMEALQGVPDPQTVDRAWPQLANGDRFIRFAARIAIEWQEVALWRARALGETNAEAGLTALLALARCSGHETQPDLLHALAKFPLASLPEAQQLEKLRVLQLSFIRQGRPAPELAKLVVDELDPLYPATSYNLNRELVKLLVYLDAPGVIAKTLSLLAAAPTQEEQVDYIYNLRNVKSGWTLPQRQIYFGWFTNAVQGGTPEVTYPAGGAYIRLTNQVAASRLHSPQLFQWFKDVDRDYGDGASYAKYLANIRRDAAVTLTGEERAALAPLLQDTLAAPAWKPVKPRQFVKSWTVDDLLPALAEVSHGRNFASGQAAFNDAQCIRCHQLGNEGGFGGPELTGAASKYSLASLLESIIEPSKVIADQYENENVFTKDGEVVSGRVIAENAERIVVMPSLLAPQHTVTIPLSEIDRREASKISPMPPGLVDQLTAPEILDLLAYIEAMGHSNARNFKP